MEAGGTVVTIGSSTNLASRLNDGLYGSGSSWAPASNDVSPFLVVRFNRLVPLSSIAWARDNRTTGLRIPISAPLTLGRVTSTKLSSSSSKH